MKNEDVAKKPERYGGGLDDKKTQGVLVVSLVSLERPEGQIGEGFGDGGLQIWESPFGSNIWLYKIKNIRLFLFNYVVSGDYD